MRDLKVCSFHASRITNYAVTHSSLLLCTRSLLTCPVDVPRLSNLPHLSYLPSIQHVTANRLTKGMKRRDDPFMRRRIALILLAAAVAVATVSVVFKIQYPFGRRTCYVPCLMMDLRMYSIDHSGWYPRNLGSYADSLRELYPKYSVNPELLAGLSGDRQNVKEILTKRPTSFTTNDTSWIYIPGFREDDMPPVAILWDKRGDLRWNASRGNGHAVGMSDGSHRQVFRHEWPTFEEEQTKLRAKILASRPRAQ